MFVCVRIIRLYSPFSTLEHNCHLLSLSLSLRLASIVVHNLSIIWIYHRHEPSAKNCPPVPNSRRLKHIRGQWGDMLIVHQDWFGNMNHTIEGSRVKFALCSSSTSTSSSWLLSVVMLLLLLLLLVSQSIRTGHYRMVVHYWRPLTTWMFIWVSTNIVDQFLFYIFDRQQCALAPDCPFDSFLY